MTAPLFLVSPSRLDGALPGGPLFVDGEEGRHAVTVRRIQPGERVDIADGAGRVARCAVVAVAKGRLELQVRDVAVVPSPTPRLVLVQALAKSGRDELAVETATEVGVDAVVPWQAARSVVRWEGERGERSRRRWEATARAAAKQSRRVWVPVIEVAVTTAQLARRSAGTRLLVLHEAADRPLTDIPLPDAGEVLVAVGPEGGVTDEELRSLEQAGGVAVRLGPEVLRSSTAGPVALALLAVRLGRWA